MAGKKEDLVDGKGGGKRAGLAPFASLEDLSDDSPPDDKNRLTLPGIKEDPSPSGAPGVPGSGGQRPSITPRIDISRASSSSHHDDSSPERELFSGGAEGSSSGGGTTKIGLGFTEEMAQELRNSTEELDFQDPEEETKTRRKKLHQQQAVGFIHVTKHELEAQSEKESRERKDSACSEGGLLLIGGRTSRLSSIGSVASGGSVASHISAGSAISGNSHLSAASRVSGQSHLSAASNYSKASRCSSPHRMLLETSFCGPKPIPTLSLETEYPPSESVEAALLARKTDITGAILPPEESMKPGKPFNSKSILDVKSTSSKSNTLDVKSNKASRSHSERIAKTSGPAVVAARSSSARSHKRPELRTKRNDENALVRIIPLHGSLDDSDDTLAPDPEPEEAKESSTDQSSSAPFTPEYGIYIPLKGPIDDPSIRQLAMGSSRLPPPKQKVAKTVSQPPPDTKPKNPEVVESDLVRFISLHGDDDEDIRRERERSKTETQRPASRNSQNVQFRTWTDDMVQCVQKDRQSVKKPRTPEPKSKCKPSTLSVTSKNGRPAQSMTNLPRDESRTPSPASSFTRSLLFRRSSDSSGSSRKSANTTGSSDSKTKKDSKNKSMFTSLFKKTPKSSPTAKAQEKPAIDPKFTNVEFKFKQEKEPESIIIPLHSPDSVIKPCVFTAPDEITPDTQEQERKQSKHSPKETKEGGDDLLRSMKKVLENKNIIVVDVINSDTAVCYEAIIETPRANRSAAQKKSDKPSDSIGVIELENLESEPRVRRSSHSSCKDVDEIKMEPVQSTSAASSTKIPAEKYVVDEPSLERQMIEELERKFMERERAVAASTMSKTPEGEAALVQKEESRDSSKRSSRDVTEEKILKRISREMEEKIEETLKRFSGEFVENQMETVSKRSSRDSGEDLKSAQPEEVPVAMKKELSAGSKISSQPSKEENEEKRSSESEVEISGATGETKPVDECDEERKGLFHQTESVEDELPYVPTTLPQERSVAVPIIPVSQRISEVKTCPVERPRSTTPIQPSNLDEYAASHDSTSKLSKTEKMQITLPRIDSIGRRNSQGRPKPWTQFAEEALQSPKETRKREIHETPQPSAAPPPLPPRGAVPGSQWVMFDEQPERRRAPKRITTLPLRHPQQPSAPVVYSYVNPEECSCECHESQPPKTNSSAQCLKNDSEPCTYKKGSRTDKRYRT